MQIMLSEGFGGAERLFVDCCFALAEAGVEVIAVCHPRFVEMDKLRHDKITIATLKVHFDYSFLATIRLERIVSRYQPDVIHTHLCRAAMIGGRVGRKCRIPVAANIHNYIKLKYYKNISKFIPGTADQKKYLMSLGVKSVDIEIVPHFSLLDSATEVQYKKSNVIISYGRFVKKKGFDLLLAAVKLITAQGGDVRLLLGGDGPERLHIEQKISALGLESKVELVGWVHDVGHFLEKGDVFVLPSLDEPFGIAVLEAMAKGKVIVSSKTKGPLEVLDPGSAWLFDINNAQDLAHSILSALNSPEEAVKKAKKAMQIYDDQYSSKSIVPRYIALFESMC